VQFQASGLSPVVLRVMVGAAGCTALSADVTVPVTTAQATITPGGATTFCEGQTLTLTASEGASYAWTNGATTRSIVVDATGSYAVKVTTAGGCEATSAPVEVTVNAAPAAAISASGPLAFCEAARSR
jgi:hypothetical protein